VPRPRHRSVQRVSSDEGPATWVCSDLREGDEEEMEAVLKLSEGGKSVREIAKEINKGKSSVGRLLKKAKRVKKDKSVESNLNAD
jgi:predicted transcriptional regulator